MARECVWKTGSTTDGGYSLPEKCISRGCNGGPFKSRPLCKDFREYPPSTVPTQPRPFCRRRPLALCTTRRCATRITWQDMPVDLQNIVRVNTALVSCEKARTVGEE